MDLSSFISDLLSQHGEISIPGLGYLAQARMPGYYNTADGKYHPPYHQVLFDEQQIEDDDTLTQYIADRKDISLSSAKYFTEKYIASLKQDVLIKEIALGNLGWFYTEQAKLTFRAEDTIVDDPTFFGLAPVKITKIGHTPVFVPAVKKVEAPKEEPHLDLFNQYIANLPADDELAEEKYAAPAEVYEESGQHTRPNLLIVILLAIVILAAGLFVVYKYFPDTFARLWGHQQTTAEPKTDEEVPKAKPRPAEIQPVLPKLRDTTIKDTGNTPQTDTAKAGTTVTAKPTVNKSATPADNKIAETKAGIAAAKAPVAAPTPVTGTATPSDNPALRWEIVEDYNSVAAADAAINNFNQKGINYYHSKNTRGKAIKIAFGAYITNDQADNERVKMIAAKKIPKDAYIEEIKPIR